MTTVSPLIWFGGKGKQAEHIIYKMPDHKVYIEPFGGAAHVISQKSRTRHEVYNDIDGIVVNFILQSIENTEALIERCAALPYSRELYECWRREELPMDPLEKAVRFFYLNRSAISKGNAEEVPKTGWRHSTTSSQNPAMGYVNACQKIRDFAARMQGVMIERLDFRTIIEKYDSEQALFYVDPPYVGREKFYAGGFSQKDHYELGELLNSIKGKAIVSYYEDPIIQEIYGHWNIEKHGAFKQAVGGQNVGGQAEELLIMNYATTQISLF
ncbi:DNA adenine methylase [Paenibacillus sp. FSL R7-0337]|uniref:DNA adenine methylase n=1 Tax=Paenibacillus sp. FSL R7-0337 TaxID=1926588 RepID=UPI00096D7CDC|nr:DNA adenine methylase [Paenibacillus sp. FSL R7-0337]OMF98200.1 DNA methyltransferase [Paenibacillus sp. FSL R7-0337]